MTLPAAITRNVNISLAVEFERRRLDDEGRPVASALHREAVAIMSDLWMRNDNQRARLLRLAAVCHQWLAVLDQEGGR